MNSDVKTISDRYRDDIRNLQDKADELIPPSRMMGGGGVYVESGLVVAKYAFSEPSFDNDVRSYNYEFLVNGSDSLSLDQNGVYFSSDQGYSEREVIENVKDTLFGGVGRSVYWKK